MQNKAIFIINSSVNEWGETHIHKVERDRAIHYKSGIYVTENHGFVSESDVLPQYSAKNLYDLMLKNAWNGYFSKQLCEQYKAQALVEKTLQQRKSFERITA